MIVTIFIRPKKINEAVWAVAGAAALVAFGLLPWRSALSALERGTGIYLFLIGMMILAEIARTEGLFAWAAAAALRASRGSQFRLFALVYLVGIVVTALLSNDATAVVLTPAVYAALARTNVKPLPYLFVCAFIANAASFVLPISNPANLVVFASHLPLLRTWIDAFGIPSIVAIAGTFFFLYLDSRASLRGTFLKDGADGGLSRGGKVALAAVSIASIVLVTVAWLGMPIGITTLALGLGSIAAVAFADRNAPALVLKHISWTVVPLVGGLFVIVAALDRSGALRAATAFLSYAQTLAPVFGNLLVGSVVGLGSNVLNNLPVGLISGIALSNSAPAAHIVHATLIGVDLAPNLSVTGSLATILWLVALRREGVEVTAWRFLRTGAIVLIPTLILTLVVVR
ncbi:MAG TPA: SLC13 family permease [Candidatus Baltobacteraceae bacterium]